MSGQKGTAVFVHGAWADGSCWQNVILPLERLGLNVNCAPLPLTSLSDDIAALTRTLERTDGPVVLVGHAYAGAVIAGPTDDRIKALVYVSALAPGEGETVAQVFYREPPHPEAPKLAPDSYGFIWMPADGFQKAVAHKASADQTAIMAAVQRPIAVKCIQEATPPPTWRTKPTWYLLAEEDRMIKSTTQRFMAERMGAKICSYPVDHTAMYTEPNVVVDVIWEAVRETFSTEVTARRSAS
ncbi:MAG: alpha/beta hydrolase [Candidatus Acidiferrales bacterium]